MAAFLAGKLARERNGRVVAKRKRQLSESVEIVENAKTSVLSFLNMAEYSQSRETSTGAIVLSS